MREKRMREKRVRERKRKRERAKESCKNNFLCTICNKILARKTCNKIFAQKLKQNLAQNSCKALTHKSSRQLELQNSYTRNNLNCKALIQKLETNLNCKAHARSSKQIEIANSSAKLD